MGGHALKNVSTRRYTRTEYFLLKERILNKLQGHINRFDVPKEFPCKDSFGDLDILLVVPSSTDVRTLINELFHPTEIVHNGDVYSFDVEQFQIDFILVDEERFDNALVYFSYSDLGGLIGNICQKIGLKYGIQGLWMNVHDQEGDPTTTSTRLILSTDVKQIFHFLGYDYETYCQGFQHENDFFQWIRQGKYFRSSYFDDNRLNHAHRQRSSKRPVFMKFRAYLNEQNVDQNEINRSFDDDADQLIFTVRQQALIYFNKQDEYHRIIQEREDKRHIREKYNGRYFSDLDNDKSMIHVHMKSFEKRFAQTDEEFRRWVIKTDVEQIKQEIDKYKQEFQQNHSCF